MYIFKNPTQSESDINVKMNTDEIFISNTRPEVNYVESNFSDRQKSLFDQLQKAEDINKNRIIKNETPMDIATKQSHKRKRSETKCFQGKESIFKRPEEPLSKCLPVRHIPDFRKNPHKWTKYSLDDVRSEDTSEKANTAAALSFLREMELRKSAETNKMDIEDDKIKFNKSALLQRKTTDEKIDEKTTFKGSKILMPEYVVGQAKKNVRRNLTKKNSEFKGKEVKLDHLLEYEDDTE